MYTHSESTWVGDCIHTETFSITSLDDAPLSREELDDVRNGADLPFLESFTFTYTNSDGTETEVRRLYKDGAYLGDIANLFLSFLRGAGYDYVESVSIDTGVETITRS